MDRGAWHLKDNPWGHKELNMTEAIWHTHTLTLPAAPARPAAMAGEQIRSQAVFRRLDGHLCIHDTRVLVSPRHLPLSSQENPTYSSRSPPHLALSTNQLAFPPPVSLGPLCLTLIVALDLTEPTHAVFTALYQVLCLPIKTQFLERGITFACLPHTPGLGTGHRALVTLS